MTYAEKLRDPRWQKMRLTLLELAQWKCSDCEREDRTLEIHHKFYRPHADPWDYEYGDFRVLCSECHEQHQTRMIEFQKIFGTLDWPEQEQFLHDLSEAVMKGGNLHYLFRRFSYLAAVEG